MKDSIKTFLIIALVFFTTMLLSTTANAQIEKLAGPRLGVTFIITWTDSRFYTRRI